MSLGVFPPLNLFKEFEKNQYEFLLVCLVKFTCEATWSLTFVCREFVYRFYFTSSGWPVQVVYFLYVQFRWTLDRISWWLSGKESACNVRDEGSIPELEDALEEEVATHSSILAWGIPWAEEPRGCKSRT